MINVNNFIKKTVTYNSKSCTYGLLKHKDIIFFNELLRHFPSKSMFECSEGLERPFGQRPHNRFSLAFKKNIYSDLSNHQKSKEGRGVCEENDLMPIWRDFLAFLVSDAYINFLSDFFKTSNFEQRFAWHIMGQGQDLSPHVDSPNKLGAQLFYFNSPEDWKNEWGGNTLLCLNKLIEQNAPELSDFSKIVSIDNLKFGSMIFINNDDAWHSVKKISAPNGFERRVMMMVINKI